MRINYEPIYNYPLLNWRIKKLGTTPAALAAERDDITPETVRRAMKGLNTSAEKLRIIADMLDLNPKYWFDFTLTTERQFSRAVVTGKSRSGR